MFLLRYLHQRICKGWMWYMQYQQQSLVPVTECCIVSTMNSQSQGVVRYKNIHLHIFHIPIISNTIHILLKNQLCSQQNRTNGNIRHGLWISTSCNKTFSTTTTPTPTSNGGDDDMNNNDSNKTSVDDIPNIEYVDDEEDIDFDHSDYNAYYSLIDFTADDPNIPYFRPPNDANNNHQNHTTDMLTTITSLRQQIDEGVQKGLEYRMAQKDVMNLNCRTCPICRCVFVGGRFYMLHHLFHHHACTKEVPLHVLQELIKQKEDMDGVQYEDVILEDKVPKPKKKKQKKKKLNPTKVKKREKEYLKWAADREREANKKPDE
jgi:hypothetical protein